MRGDRLRGQFKCKMYYLFNYYFRIFKPVLGLLFEHTLIILSFFSSPEPKAQGELIGWESSGRPSVLLSVCLHFQT